MSGDRVTVADLEAQLDGIREAIDALAALQKSAPVTPPDPRIEDVLSGIGSISKTVSDLKADGESRDGEFKALRKDMSQILSMPVPGRAPLRMISPEMTKAVSHPATNEANALRKAAAGAPAAIRDYILNEAAAIERSK